MENTKAHEVTRLLKDWRRGNAAALDHLLPLVEAELRRLARICLQREQHRHTLQTDALVNDAWLRLIEIKQVEWEDRAHFFSLVATLMRRVLVDLARARCAVKRGAGAQPEELSEETDEVKIVTHQQSLSVEDLLALDEALTRLAAEDARSCRVVEFHFFGGLTFDEIARIEGVSTRTLKEDWSFARARLRQTLAAQ